MTGYIISFFILVLLVIAWRYASTREASTAVTTKPKRLLSFTTAHTTHDVLQILIEKTQGSEYSIDSVDEEHLSLILSTPPTATTWGFFYPVYLTQQDDGRTLVEVGIQSKLYQMGPLVRRQHERCFAHVKGVLYQQV